MSRMFSCDRCLNEIGTTPPKETTDTTRMTLDDFAIDVTVSIYAEETRSRWPDLCKKCREELFKEAREAFAQ